MFDGHQILTPKFSGAEEQPGLIYAVSEDWMECRNSFLR